MIQYFTDITPTSFATWVSASLQLCYIHLKATSLDSLLQLVENGCTRCSSIDRLKI